MVLPTSGPLSILQIANEFGGQAPHSLSEYYSADTGIPASGTISIGEFYGKSNFVAHSATGGDYTVTVGSYKYHIFKSTGAHPNGLSVSSVGTPSNIEVLIVAGGGGGGGH
jgi:hypothetical protein